MENYESLTEREWQVAVLAAGVRGNKEIAAELRLAESTIKGHLEAIYHKLAIHNRVELANWVWERRKGAE